MKISSVLPTCWNRKPSCSYTERVILNILAVAFLSAVGHRDASREIVKDATAVHSNTDLTVATTRNNFLRDEIPPNPLLPGRVYSPFTYSPHIAVAPSCIFYSWYPLRERGGSNVWREKLGHFPSEMRVKSTKGTLRVLRASSAVERNRKS